MTEQQDLFSDLLPIVRHRGHLGETIQQKFERFHSDNPHIYRILVRLARQAAKAGRRHFGIGMLYEQMRWSYFVQTTGEDYKLCNNYRSRYVRLIEKQEPDLKGFFILRELRTP